MAVTFFRMSLLGRGAGLSGSRWCAKQSLRPRERNCQEQRRPDPGRITYPGVTTQHLLFFSLQALNRKHTGIECTSSRKPLHTGLFLSKRGQWEGVRVCLEQQLPQQNPVCFISGETRLVYQRQTHCLSPIGPWPWFQR